MRDLRVGAASVAVALCMFIACKSDSPVSVATPTTPSPPVASGPVVHTVTVSADTTSLTQRGATAQYRAIAIMSNGTSEDRTANAAWSSSNQTVATVSAQGLVTAQGEGDATITARLSDLEGSRGVAVRLAPAPPPPPAPGTANRTPDPPAGQRLPLPSDAQAQIERIAAARMDLLINQSCPRNLKYVRNPWLDYMLDELRKLDTRWGYNAKPNRTAADNSGVPVEVAGDEITYHFGAGPDEGSQDVYPIDILLGHCGPTPSVTFRVFTGEEPVRWTGAGRF